jgi:hypothetical protein
VPRPDPELLPWIESLTGADRAGRGGRIQSLWSGYGELFRVYLDGAAVDSVVVKEVRPPEQPGSHRGHARKLTSYEVELDFYRRWSARCGAACRVPAFVGGRARAGRLWLVLEDLDAAGFSGRRRAATLAEIAAVLRWLAAFHAGFVGVEPEGLWPVGTYWHLATRPDELCEVADPALRAAAAAIDARLSGARHRTLVHGDAKVANFCFADVGPGVAAVDFQYVGGGCGAKDVAYFLSSALDNRGLEAHADRLIDGYFAALRGLLPDGVDGAALEAEWRELMPWAWADFMRFFAGWAPGHHLRERYALRQTARVLAAAR